MATATTVPYMTVRCPKCNAGGSRIIRTTGVHHRGQTVVRNHACRACATAFRSTERATKK